MSKSRVREALVASVACDRAAGQAPEQEAVDGAEGELAALGGGARARRVVEQPGDLGGGEIGVDDEAGRRRDRGSCALGLQPRATLGGAPVLPDDRVGDRLAGLALPDDRGLALVGDADRRQILRFAGGAL